MWHIEINGMPDYRIQKANEYTKRYSDMYLLDNQMQLLTAMEDFEYTKWLDPEVFLPMSKIQYLQLIIDDNRYSENS